MVRRAELVAEALDALRSIARADAERARASRTLAKVAEQLLTDAATEEPAAGATTPIVSEVDRARVRATMRRKGLRV